MLLGDSAKSTAMNLPDCVHECVHDTEPVNRLQDGEFQASAGNLYQIEFIMTTTPEARYSLIIPAYNEEHRITPFFDAIDGFEGELIVVCDGGDSTADIVDRIAKQRQDLTIRCLRFDHRLGKGGGVIAGLEAARSPLVGYFDADGSTRC